jgi:tRNA uridine 5-carboxymethylaminomethyl modification enzyme
MKQYDCIVVGAGHAGVEAAYAASRMGCRVLLVTMNLETIGAMSCNPAIGGIGKSQLVREVDALGGLMAKAADACGMQFRMLNASKGPAVRSLRVQEDMFRYKSYVKAELERQEGLEVYQAEVAGFLTDGPVVVGVKTSLGESFGARAVVVTPGTFLNGLIHIGLTHSPGGRLDEAPSSGLSEDLKRLGFQMGRFKTGTCPRLDGRSIDYDALQRQDGDEPPTPFSFRTASLEVVQKPCHVTFTNPRTHEIIRAGLDRSPLYTGKITSTGVRYCPSIEDKVVRFADRERHQIFLEPEGFDTVEVYPNGISTSLPLDVQMEMIHSIRGLERARLMKPGYGIEYDYVDPIQLLPTLETKLYRNLFLAGQINGTTGYEEAAAQGLVAGINAALRVREERPFVLSRDEAYMGVLIDDLTTKGTQEPYRMFTSRVEYRLILRQDNADLRLSARGRRIGLLDEVAYQAVEDKKKRIAETLAYLRATKMGPAEANPWLETLGTSPIDSAASLEELLRRPQVAFSHIRQMNHIDDNLPFLTPQLDAQVETEVKYEGFIRRQADEVERFKKMEHIRIPQDMDYAAVKGLSAEIVEKLKKFRPVSLGQASRISGVTPAAVALLSVVIAKNQKEKDAHAKDPF